MVRLKRTFCLLLLLCVLMPSSVVMASSEASLGVDYSNVDYVDNSLGMSYVGQLGLPGFGLEGFDIRNVIVNILKYIMSAFGLVAVCVIMLAGFKLMVANGSEDAIKQARSMIIGGVIGMSTIVGAYAIVSLVINATNNVIAGNF